MLFFDVRILHFLLIFLSSKTHPGSAWTPLCWHVMAAVVRRGRAWRSSVSQNRGLPPHLAGPWTLMRTARGTNYNWRIMTFNWWKLWTTAKITIIVNITITIVRITSSTTSSNLGQIRIMNYTINRWLLFVAVFKRSRSVSGASTGLSSSPLSSPRVRTFYFILLLWTVLHIM